MFQAVTAFGGGVWAAQKFGHLQLPHLSRAQNETGTFKLSVSVLSADVKGLQHPGFIARERPRLEVVVGDVRKETEFADFREEANTNDGDEGTGLWRFGDTLTFAASGADVLGPGVRIWLRTQSDVRLGPFQVNLAQTRDVGVCSVDLRTRILPACVFKDHDALGVGTIDQPVWESPMLELPLTHIGTGSSPDLHFLGKEVAKVSLNFSVNVDPKELLQAADYSAQTFVDRWVYRPVKWVAAASEAVGCLNDEEICADRSRRRVSELPICDLAPRSRRMARICVDCGPEVVPTPNRLRAERVPGGLVKQTGSSRQLKPAAEEDRDEPQVDLTQSSKALTMHATTTSSEKELAKASDQADLCSTASTLSEVPVDEVESTAVEGSESPLLTTRNVEVAPVVVATNKAPKVVRIVTGMNKAVTYQGQRGAAPVSSVQVAASLSTRSTSTAPTVVTACGTTAPSSSRGASSLSPPADPGQSAAPAAQLVRSAVSPRPSFAVVDGSIAPAQIVGLPTQTSSVAQRLPAGKTSSVLFN